MSVSECTDERLRLSPANFTRLARFVTAELGIKMPDSKRTMVQSRLLRRVRDLGLDSIEQYLDRFFASPDTSEERIHLINAITTNKTDFFREPKHFDYLREAVLTPSFLSAHREVTFWSAGCSSGEEPYTLAIVLNEHRRQYPGFRFSILATDVSTRVLERAREGIYEQPQIHPVPPLLRARYFMRSRDRSRGIVRVCPELRQQISFHRLNLMDQVYRVRDSFDVVFFRNVLIYFDRSTQEAVVNKICLHLRPGGYLFVSHSESLAGLKVPLEPVRAAMFRKTS